MDKGFNDDELADIMNEIESLEKEFTEEVDSKSDNSENDNVEIVEAATDDQGDDDDDAMPDHQMSEADEMAAALEALETVDEEDNSDDESDDESDEDDSFEEEDFEEDTFEESVLGAKPNLDEMAPILEAPKSPVTKQEKEILHKVTQIPVENVFAKHNTSVKHSHSAKTSMSFNVQGDMSLNLSFNISGKIVELSVNDKGLELELDGGMKFSVPLEVSQHGKKAA